MRRRNFITGLVSTTAAWPLPVRAQRDDRMRRVGVIGVTLEDDPQSSRRANAFQEGLEKLGWTIGRNLQIDYRWGASDAERANVAAAELMKLTPDVILANSPPAA